MSTESYLWLAILMGVIVLVVTLPSFGLHRVVAIVIGLIAIAFLTLTLPFSAIAVVLKKAQLSLWQAMRFLWSQEIRILPDLETWLIKIERRYWGDGRGVTNCLAFCKLTERRLLVALLILITIGIAVFVLRRYQESSTLVGVQVFLLVSSPFLGVLIGFLLNREKKEEFGNERARIIIAYISRREDMRKWAEDNTIYEVLRKPPENFEAMAGPLFDFFDSLEEGISWHEALNTYQTSPR